MPGSAGLGMREFGDLLIGSSKDQNLFSCASSQAEEVAIRIRDFVAIGQVENLEFLVMRQLRQPLRGTSVMQIVVLVVEEVSVSTPIGPLGMERARIDFLGCWHRTVSAPFDFEGRIWIRDDPGSTFLFP
jgi:hypothetical protein